PTSGTGAQVGVHSGLSNLEARRRSAWLSLPTALGLRGVEGALVQVDLERPQVSAQVELERRAEMPERVLGACPVPTIEKFLNVVGYVGEVVDGVSDDDLAGADLLDDIHRRVVGAEVWEERGVPLTESLPPLDARLAHPGVVALVGRCFGEVVGEGQAVQRLA